MVRVFNYGQGYWFSRQESVLFDSLLRDGHRPDAAIFIDGLNDTVQPGSSYAGIPFSTEKTQKLFDDQAIFARLVASSAMVKMLRHFRLLDLARQKSLYQLPPDVSTEVGGRQIVINYAHNFEHTNYLCKDYEVDCYFFWQPVPFYRYDNPRDTLSLQNLEMPLVKWVYDHIDATMQGLPNFENLSDMLERYEGQAFVDGFHYSAPVNRMIAERVLARIKIN